MPNRYFGRVIAGVIIAAVVTIGARSLTLAQQAGPARTVLLKHDLPMSGYEAVLVEVTMPVGTREGRHTHPGSALVYVQEGALTLDHDGRPTVTYKVGESFFVDAGRVHEGMNRGNATVKAIATFIVEKGKAMTTQVP